MTLDELKSKNPSDLKLHQRELNEELFKLKLKKSMGQLEKNHQLKQVRKNIARTLTIYNQKVKKGK